MISRAGMKVGPHEHTVIGDMLEVGQPAPDFELLTSRRKVRSLADYADKVIVISAVPSVDTSVCDAQTRRFNQESASLGDDIVVLTVSSDTPFALGRYCGNNGIENTETLSTYMDMQMAKDYGIYDVDWRVCQRAVFVIDKAGILRHVEYVPMIGDEVDFDKALAVARELV